VTGLLVLDIGLVILMLAGLRQFPALVGIVWLGLALALGTVVTRCWVDVIAATRPTAPPERVPPAGTRRTGTRSRTERRVQRRGDTLVASPDRVELRARHRHRLTASPRPLGRSGYGDDPTIT
jgi:hypothetical protein